MHPVPNRRSPRALSHSMPFRRAAPLIFVAVTALTACDATEEPLAPLVEPAPPSFAYNGYTTKPFGAPMGDLNGVYIYSNSSVGGNQQPNNWKGVYTGERWQCVEFARRYELIKHNITLPPLGINGGAFLFWDNKDMNKLLRRVSNGAVELPQMGDVIVLSGGSFGGHVGVVKSATSKTVMVAQQNTPTPIQGYEVTTSTLGGQTRYTVKSALGNHQVAGWFTRKTPPILVPAIKAISPSSPRVTTTEQTIQLTTSGIAEGVTMTLYDPRNNPIRFQSGNLKLTSAGLSFKVAFYMTGKWTVRLTQGGLTSTTFSFTVRK
jgi:hypothetical protein